jgi:hypothetical protein
VNIQAHLLTKQWEETPSDTTKPKLLERLYKYKARGLDEAALYLARKVTEIEHPEPHYVFTTVGKHIPSDVLCSFWTTQPGWASTGTVGGRHRLAVVQD